MVYYFVGVLIVLSVLLFWIRWRKQTFLIFVRNGIPGPKPNFWTGHLNEVLEMREAFAYENTKRYGNIFGYFFGALPIINVTDPELIKLIQVKEFKNFPNRTLIFPNGGIPHSVIIEALPFQEDEEWKNMRSVITPAFSTGKIKKMLPIINNAIEEFLENINQSAREKGVFDIYHFHKQLTLDIICRIAYGINTYVQQKHQSLLLQSIKLVFGADISNIFVKLIICFPELEPLPTKLTQFIDAVRYALGYSAIRVIFEASQRMLEQRRHSKQKRNDLLQSLIEGKVEWKKLLATKYEDLAVNIEDSTKEQQNSESSDVDSNVKKLTDDNIKANAILFMAVGFDTTSHTLGYTSHYLSTHPDVQEKVRNEIKDTIGDRKNVEYEDLAKLQYLDQVISEVLRLHPVTSILINRVTKEEYKYKGITIPKGMLIAIPAHTIQRNPDYWPDPDKFIPERFSPESKNNISPSHYQPFGNGPRNCVGIRFAQTAMKLILVRLLMSYRLECSENENLNYHYTVFLIHPSEVMVRAVPI